jgi:integrase
MGTRGRKLAREIPPVEIKRLTKPGFHTVGHVVGLGLQVTPSKSVPGEVARSWILRYSAGTRRREMGLGNYPSVTLAKACQLARDARDLLRDGIDPIEDAKAKRSALAAAVPIPTFDTCVIEYIEAHSPAWKGTKNARLKTAILRNYASPHFGKLQVSDVQTAHVLKALKPIWLSNPPTAKKLRLAIEAVLAYAAAHKYRDKGENPAAWRGNLKDLLPKRPAGKAKVTHMASLDYDQIGDFMPQLRAVEGMGARALEFAILTAARSGEVRGATWSEIDFDAATWTIPADRMKTGTMHRIPLSDAALELLRALPRIDDVDVIFPSVRGGPLSDMTMTAVLRRMGVPVTVHGFRSTFRTWGADKTKYQREILEVALAHTVGDEAEQAYQRGEMLDKRRRVMDAWAKFVNTPSPKSAAVVPLRKVKVAS